MATAQASAGVFARIWGRYSTALRERPIRTRMIQAGILFAAGDAVAQFGIENRRLKSKDGQEPEWDAMRTMRLGFYGGVMFAPLGHVWLKTLERIHAGPRWSTLAVRMTADAMIWAPFVAALFHTSLSVLEGKSLKDVQRKLEMAWYPTWAKAVCVFTPAQLVNQLFVPFHLRLLLLNSVGLCWNVYLSWLNNVNNKRLAATHAVMQQLEQQGVVDPVKLEQAQANVEAAKEKREKITKEGSADGVARRMSWA